MKPLVILKDGIESLKSDIPAGSVDLILSDLPSGETRAPFDVKPDLNELWSGIWHALKIDGVACLMASSIRFAAELIAYKWFRYDLVWHKSLATGHLNSRYRPLRAHEFVLVFFRERGIYKPQMVETGSPIHKARRTSHGGNYGAMTAVTESRAGETDRYPTSVLEFSSVGTSSKERIHPQQKPRDMLQWLIRTYTNSGDLVVDPFAGSGSTGHAALAEGRRFLGWNINSKYGRS